MRRRCRRRVLYNFNDYYYKPRGVPLSDIEEAQITDEEMEALRLRYIDDLGQKEAAKKMGISQSQYQRDITKALKEIVKALIDGKAIHIKKLSNFSKKNTMKVLISMDSKKEEDKISNIFGRCKYFAIYNLEDKNVDFKENPGAGQTGGAGISAAQFALDLGVSKVYTGNVGPNAQNVLEQGNIEINIEEGKTLKEIINGL